MHLVRDSLGLHGACHGGAPLGGAGSATPPTGVCTCAQECAPGNRHEACSAKKLYHPLAIVQRGLDKPGDHQLGALHADPSSPWRRPVLRRAGRLRSAAALTDEQRPDGADPGALPCKPIPGKSRPSSTTISVRCSCAQQTSTARRWWRSRATYHKIDDGIVAVVGGFAPPPLLSLPDAWPGITEYPSSVSTSSSC